MPSNQRDREQFQPGDLVVFRGITSDGVHFGDHFSSRGDDNYVVGNVYVVEEHTPLSDYGDLPLPFSHNNLLTTNPRTGNENGWQAWFFDRAPDCPSIRRKAGV